ncbi:MAG: nucleoside deaminase [Candidatus Ancillula trichonymphae]|jgi:tRNA(adenine34) deaminase|nr:nucleoside deaminase [Candidatus Ancillula trichonymphae]
MRKALELCRGPEFSADIPVVALVTQDDEIVAAAGNLREKNCDPFAHAEILALQAASKKLNTTKLHNCALISTLEPCIMCTGAILNTQIGTVVFGAFNEKFGAAGSKWDLLRDPLAPHHPEVIGGILEEECSFLLKEFFDKLRLKSETTTGAFSSK